MSTPPAIAEHADRPRWIDMEEGDGVPLTVVSYSPWTICYRPLYFEEIDLERYGCSAGFVQPALSGARLLRIGGPHALQDGGVAAALVRLLERLQPLRGLSAARLSRVRVELDRRCGRGRRRGRNCRGAALVTRRPWPIA